MNEVCKICGATLDPFEDKICECCFERMNEDKEQELEETQTEEIFGSEEAYYRYRNG